MDQKGRECFPASPKLDNVPDSRRPPGRVPRHGERRPATACGPLTSTVDWTVLHTETLRLTCAS